MESILGSLPMAVSNPLKDLEFLIRSHFGLVYIDTTENDRVESLLSHLADSQGLPYFIWTATKGLRNTKLSGSVYQSEDVSKALSHLEQSASPGLFFFEGLGDTLAALHTARVNGIPQSAEDKVLSRRVKDVIQSLSKSRGALVVTGSGLTLPEELAPVSSRLKLPEPDTNDFKELVIHVMRDLKSRMHIDLALSPEDGVRLLQNLRGLTLMEARKILTRVLLEKRVLGPDVIKAVVEAKKSIVQQDGLLEYYPVEESLSNIADMAGLKNWLIKRKLIVASPEKASSFGLSFPKGILLLGVQGCGKSLCAKAVAMEWQLPLLRFDPSGLYNKYIGETEKNFKRAVQVAEQMAPVILWIDEIEKAFSSAGSDQDGGVSQRLLGAFLTWMQERKREVFLIATANDVAKLPPEFLRKGRFDEIFFVDLPTADARHDVFKLHLKKRNRNPAEFDLPALVKASEGFSGAEIEQAIVSGLYSAFSGEGKLTTDLLLHEVNVTRPLSETMSEKVHALREWAKERTVSAN